MGERIPGYKEPIALMTKEAGNALKKVSEYIREKGYLIKIFNAYVLKKQLIILFHGLKIMILK